MLQQIVPIIFSGGMGAGGGAESAGLSFITGLTPGVAGKRISVIFLNFNDKNIALHTTLLYGRSCAQYQTYLGGLQQSSWPAVYCQHPGQL